MPLTRKQELLGCKERVAALAARLSHQYSVLATKTFDGDSGTFTESISPPFPRYLWPAITESVTGATRLLFVVVRVE